MMNKQKGTALISILALTSLALAVISSTTVVSVINARINLGQLYAQKAYQSVNSLTDEVVLSFARERNYINPYSDWTNDCLQIKGFDCKMEVNLTENGGVFEIWGKYRAKQRQMRVELNVDEQERVSATKEEVY